MKSSRAWATAVLAAVVLASGAAVTCAPEPERMGPTPAKSASIPIPLGEPVDGDGQPMHPSGAELDAGVCWRDLAPLHFERAHHAATILPGGGVLVIGGIGVRSLSSVEYYDPKMNVWSLRTSMPTERRALAATVLDTGLVLVTGGTTERDNGPNTPPDVVPLNTVELYDPDSDGWEVRAPMHGRRWFHAAHRLPDGRVLVAGGVLEQGQVAAEVYDPSTDLWTPIPFPDAGMGPRFVALIEMDEGHVMVVAHGASYIIDVEAAQWRFLAPRDGWSAENVFAARVGGEVLTFAGVSRKWSEQFNADAGTWERTAAGFALGRDMSTGLVFEEGRRYMMTGGYLAEPGWAYAKTSVTDIFESDGGTFIPAGRLKIPRLGHAMVELRPGIPMVIGGGASDARIGSSGSTSVEVFDPTCPQLGNPAAQ